jgi:hypothetical protein
MKYQNSVIVGGHSTTVRQIRISTMNQQIQFWHKKYNFITASRSGTVEEITVGAFDSIG